MTQLQMGILTLVKSALLDQKLELPQGFELKDAVQLCKEHELTPLVCEGAANCGLTKDPAFREMLQTSCQHLLVSERQGKAFQAVCRAFDKNGIDYMPLKGCLMKKRYPRHELRPMGDADILIRSEQYDRIRPLLPELGFTEQQESNHEYIWHAKNLHLELHKRLIPSYNRDYYAYFGDGWRLAQREKGTRYGMRIEAEFLYLFTHFAKHYRDGGIGCRHMVDLWVFFQTFPQRNEKYICAELKKLQLLDFYKNVCATLEVWFGNGISDVKTETITQFVFASGNWGTEEQHVLSEAVKDQALAGSVFSGKLRTALRLVFPPLSGMVVPFPFLRKAPWLMPFMWPVRWGQLVLVRREHMIHKSRSLKASTDDKVLAYRQALHDVGLDFNFRAAEE